MADPIRLRARLPASIGAARRAWTDPAELRAWLAEYAEAEPPEKPERYAFWGRYTPHGEKPRQRLLHLDDRTLRFSWHLGTEETTVEVLLEDGAVTLSQTTRLTVGLSGFDRPPYPSWTAWLSAISALRRYHELDDWRPIWLDA